MLGYIKGTIKAKTDKSVIIENNGIGYLVHTTPVNAEQSKTETVGEFFLHTHVREDILELYGLPTFEEIEFFKKLISISGVGPKTALGVFEVAKLDEIKKAVSRGDATLLTKVSGIGKKTAELIVIKLKDKNLDINLGDVGGIDGQAIDALVSLGYSAADARIVLSQLPPETQSVEDKIKSALKLLNR
ncbi:MAG: Holliday junction branch migration protein RuvA [Patescibacteria group bacterium]|jgi:Holliday junction DNA helicase RuvA